MRPGCERPSVVSRHRSVRPVPSPNEVAAASVGAMETATQPIDVVLPCLNEAGALPWLLTRMPAGYARIAADHGATVVDVPQRGFGAACHAGLLAATSDLVCIMDADGSFDPQDLEIVSSPVRNGTVDLMLGRRAPRALSAWP